MATLNPYLTFNGNCREAMTYYHSVLGGELTLTTAGESPVADEVPPEFHNSILHSALKTDNFEIMATDMIQRGFVEGNAVHLCLICKSEKEIDTYYEKLGAGGEVLQPLQQMFFGKMGRVADKFGKNWMLEFG